MASDEPAWPRLHYSPDRAIGDGPPASARPGWDQPLAPFDQEARINRRLDGLRRKPDARGNAWLLALIPAMAESIESAEWSGSPALLARFLEASLGPLPASLATPESLMAMLRRAIPELRAWGYLVRIEPDPYGGEIVSIDGTSGFVPG